MYRRLQQIIAAMFLACIAMLPVAGAAASGDVYFLGVDHAPAAGQGLHLARLYGAAAGDRWALSEVARRVSREYGAQGIGLDAPIDRWNPENDPYNFGVIIVRGAFHRTLTWPGLATRTHVTLDLGWLQIGHETRTRMQTGKLPELRFSVNAYEIREYTSAAPPDAATLDALYRETFEEALRVLLQRARQGQERDLRRSATDIRYLQVKTPQLYPDAERALAQFNSAGETQAAAQVRDALGAHLEQRLLELFAVHREMDAFVLLPGERALQYLEADWSAFAERVAALSTYNASREALGFHPPRLLRVVPLCVAEGENQVHAVELRSAVPNLRLLVDEIDAYVDQASISVLLAADTKLTLSAVKDTRLPIDGGLTKANFDTKPMDKPRQFAAGEFLGMYNVQRAADAAVAELITALAPRLRQLLDTQPLSHPSHQQGFCS